MAVSTTTAAGLGNSELLTLEIILFPALIALIGAAALLFAHTVTARNTLKIKKLGLIYENKAQTYAEFLAAAGEFVQQPGISEVYFPYLTACERVKLFCSDDVRAAFTDSNGIEFASQRLRIEDEETDKDSIIATLWSPAIERMAEAMRTDLSEHTR